jgi:4-amino-4-deoxy-L-arabinose transferase-like glycosyltransferase
VTRASLAIPRWLLAAAVLVPLLGAASPLLEVDDARYAQVPAEMLASRDFVQPTLDGTPYVEKPPLWYWACAGAYSVFGVSAAVARVAMWLIALLGLLGAWWLGAWMYSAEAGVAAATATATAALWLFLTHNMTLDMPVSVFFLWTTALTLRVLFRPEDARWAAPLAWVAAALTFLSKGLIAVVLPGALVAGLAILYPKMRRGARAMLSPPGIALAFAIAAPWFVLLQKRRPDFYHLFFYEQHFQRFLTPKYNRGEPWWFYLVVLPAGLLPWTAAFLAGLWRAVSRPFQQDLRGPALASWILGVALFFSLSHSKLATYVLPVFPHAVLLAVVALEDGLPDWAETFSRLLGGLLLLAAAVAAVALGAGLLPARLWPPPGLPAAAAPALAAWAVVLLAGFGAALAAAPSLRRPAAALAASGVLAGACLFAGLRLAAPLVSGRDVGLAAGAELRPGDALWTYGTYVHGLPFYSRHPVDKIVNFTGEFRYAKRFASQAPRFGDDSDVRRLPREGGRTLVVLHTGEYPHFSETVRGGPSSIASTERFGPWTLAVVEAAAKPRR